MLGLMDFLARLRYAWERFLIKHGARELSFRGLHASFHQTSISSMVFEEVLLCFFTDVINLLGYFYCHQVMSQNRLDLRDRVHA